MDTTGYVGLSHQVALQRRMDVVANNIANMNTTGYQREDVLFQSYIEKMPQSEIKPARSIAFVLDHGIARDNSQGELISTGGTLDTAIAGEGFYTIDRGNGQQAYTRNGKFTLAADGTLVTLSGQHVLDGGGKVIHTDPADTSVAIGADGTVRSQNGEKGRLAIVQFAGEELNRAGDNLYDAKPGAVPVTVRNVKLHTGVIESSNVKPILEMTDMMSVLRTYESTTHLLDRYEDIRKRGIETIGRVQ